MQRYEVTLTSEDGIELPLEIETRERVNALREFLRFGIGVAAVQVDEPISYTVDAPPKPAGKKRGRKPRAAPATPPAATTSTPATDAPKGKRKAGAETKPDPEAQRFIEEGR
jgi:hypothetical protein